MSTISTILENRNVDTKPQEVLLQVKALQELKKSLRKKTFDMKKPESKEKNDEKSGKQKDKKKKGETTRQYFVNFVSEVLGTALLLFLGCMGCIQTDNPPAVHHMPAIAFGLVVLLIIQIFGHISGAHLNPAVTLSTVIFRMLSPAMGVVYVAGQFLGATLGYALLKILMPEGWVSGGFCLTKPAAAASPIQALIIETIITAVLILVCCGVWDPRNAQKQDSVPLRFGLIITAIAMVAGPITGASMNTARSFGPAFLAGDYEHQWIYWIGPNVGAIIGCGIYSFIFAEEEPEEEESIELEEVGHMIQEKS